VIDPRLAASDRPPRLGVAATGVGPRVEHVGHDRAERRVGLAVAEVVVDADVDLLRQDGRRAALRAGAGQALGRFVVSAHRRTDHHHREARR